MYRVKVLAVAVALFLLVSAANAGVIVMQQETVSAGAEGATTTGRTIMIEGNREKSSDSSQSMIFDLDKGVAIVLNPAAQSATELPFPFRGPMAALMQGLYGAEITFGTTGVKQTVAGFDCAEYAGSGHVPTGDLTFTGCFAKDAPGAAEYTAFYKQFTAKMGKPANFPAGIPLKLETRVKIVASAIQGLPPEQAERIAQAAANQPPVTSSAV